MAACSSGMTFLELVWLSHVKYFFHMYVPVDVQVIYISPYPYPVT